MNLDDAGFVHDVYSLLRLKGHGLPTDKRIKTMAKAVVKADKTIPEMVVTLLMKKRRQVFGVLTALPYFHALARIEKDSVNGVRRLLITFQKLYYKSRESQCASCQYRTNCQFGKQYGEISDNILNIVVPDFKLLIDPNCPSLPSMELVSQMLSAANTLTNISAPSAQPGQLNAVNNIDSTTGGAVSTEDLSKVSKELNDLTAGLSQDDTTNVPESAKPSQDFGPSFDSGGYGRCDIFTANFDGEAIARVTEDTVNKLTKAQLLLFEIGQSLSIGLHVTKKGKFKPVTQIDENTDTRQIKNVSDVPKVLPSQNALPDEVFDTKLVKGTLSKRQNLKPDKSKKQLLYLLIDSSGSMSDQLCTKGPLALITKGAMSVAFSQALARRVRDDEGIMFVRFFDGQVSPLIHARTKEDFDMLLTKLSMNSFSGGGTDIVHAVTTAVSDIKSGKDEIARAELILMTDCQDSFNASDVVAALKGLEMNTFDVSGSKSSSVGVKAQLKASSKRYYKANETAVNLDKMVELL